MARPVLQKWTVGVSLLHGDHLTIYLPNGLEKKGNEIAGQLHSIGIEDLIEAGNQIALKETFPLEMTTDEDHHDGKDHRSDGKCHQDVIEESLREKGHHVALIVTLNDSNVRGVSLSCCWLKDSKCFYFSNA